MLGEDTLLLAKVDGARAEIFLHCYNIWMDAWNLCEGLLFHRNFLNKGIL